MTRSYVLTSRAPFYALLVLGALIFEVTDRAINRGRLDRLSEKVTR